RAAIRDFVYARVELVTDKLKKMKDAERTLAEAEAFKREYMNQRDRTESAEEVRRDPESSRLPPPQLGGRRATHFSFRNQPRRSTAAFCQANQKRFSFQVRLTALPKEARATSPFDGDGHEALESVA